jgi:hypothetical protein
MYKEEKEKNIRFTTGLQKAPERPQMSPRRGCIGGSELLRDKLNKCRIKLVFTLSSPKPINYGSPMCTNQDKQLCHSKICTSTKPVSCHGTTLNLMNLCVQFTRQFFLNWEFLTDLSFVLISSGNKSNGFEMKYAYSISTRLTCKIQPLKTVRVFVLAHETAACNSSFSACCSDGGRRRGPCSSVLD